MPRLKWLVIFSVLAFTVFAQTQASPKTLLILGDSLSSAHGIPVEQGWVNLLAKKLIATGINWQVVNASISGATTDNGLRQLPKLLEKYHPQVILIELGGNDGLRGIPFAQTRMNLQQMLELSLSFKTKPVLVEIDLPPNYGRPYRQRFRQIYASLAAKYSVPLVSFVLDNFEQKEPLLQDDGLHPNELAQPLLLQAAWPVLEVVVLAVP